MSAIELNGLTKDFPVGLAGVRLRALDSVSFCVGEGQVFGLLGPNGSGKSTAIKIMLGLLKPTTGLCRVFGIPAELPSARAAIGYLPESPYFYGFLTGRELVRYYAKMCGVSRNVLELRVSEVLSWVGMDRAADRLVSTYSKGMLQRIGFAQAVVHDPGLVILDEPTAGVDPVGMVEIAELIRALKQQGKTVLITSHILAHMEEICDRVAILDHGRLKANVGISDLAQSERTSGWTVNGLLSAELGELRTWLAVRGLDLQPAAPRSVRLDELFLACVDGRKIRPPAEATITRETAISPETTTRGVTK